jgi:hypothetical protein
MFPTITLMAPKHFGATRYYARRFVLSSRIGLIWPVRRNWFPFRQDGIRNGGRRLPELHHDLASNGGAWEARLSGSLTPFWERVYSDCVSVTEDASPGWAYWLRHLRLRTP